MASWWNLFYLLSGRFMKMTCEFLIEDWVKPGLPHNIGIVLVYGQTDCWPWQNTLRAFLPASFRCGNACSCFPEPSWVSVPHHSGCHREWAGQFHLSSLQAFPLMSFIHRTLGATVSQVMTWYQKVTSCCRHPFPHLPLHQHRKEGKYFGSKVG